MDLAGPKGESGGLPLWRASLIMTGVQSGFSIGLDSAQQASGHRLALHLSIIYGS